MSSAPQTEPLRAPGPYGLLVRGSPRAFRLALLVTAVAGALGFVAASESPGTGTLGAVGLPLAFVGLVWLPLPVVVRPPGTPRWEALEPVPVAWREVVERCLAGQGVPPPGPARDGARRVAAWEVARTRGLVAPGAVLAVLAAGFALAVSRGAPGFLVVLPAAPVQVALVLVTRRRLARLEAELG